MGSHVDPKSASVVARVVALCANKGFLSAVNSHVDFQLGRSVTRKTALVALVTFLCLRRKIDDLKLAVHIDIDFLQLL